MAHPCISLNEMGAPCRMDKEEVLSPVKRIPKRFNNCGSCYCNDGLALYCFMKRMVKPLYKISDAAKNIANGNFDVSVPVQTHDEIGVLCESFNYMTGT